MADVDEDPYAVSSDSDEEGTKKGPPPKINIEGRANADLQQIKESLATSGSAVKDEKTLEEIEELKRAKAGEFAGVKQGFEQGSVHNVDEEGRAPSKEVEKPTGIDKATLSAFKDKFENMDSTLEQNLEERLRTMEKSLEGVGKENLASMKGHFESEAGKEFTAEQRELVDIQRSEADKQRVLAAFTQAEKEEELKNCCICDKQVYPVERVVASKKLYHNACFKCSKCGKKLSPTTFNSHQGVLYCKPHMLQVLHPERAGGIEVGDEDDESPVHVDDDEEFAVTSKPKQLASDVVRAGGTNIGEELSQLKSSLKGRKEEWEASASQSATDRGEDRDFAAEIGAGKVKASKDMFIACGETGENVDDEEKRQQLEAIKGQVSEVKNKWKTGEVERAEAHEATSKEELEELKKGPKVRERFSERLQPAEGGDGVAKSYDASELEHSSAAEARKSFLEGLAFQTAPVEKSAASDLQDLKFTELGSFKDRFEKGAGDGEAKEKPAVEELEGIQLKNLKEAFEKGEAEMTPEERAERKKKEIEEEFLRYKMARKLQHAQKQQETEEECAEGAEASQEKSGLDVDIKIAGKAREKFKNIEEQAANQQANVPLPKGEHEPSKWDKKVESTAEVVNKRQVENEPADEDDEEEFDVKAMREKFAALGDSAAGAKVSAAERKLEELEGLNVAAKNLRQRFEGGDGGETEQMSEEKKHQLEEEFRQLKEERERAKQQLEAEIEQERAASAAGAEEKEDVQVAADHASKMAHKFEKIAAKEAKKAQKSQMPSK